MRMLNLANTDADSTIQTLVADLFPAELAQWAEEKEQGHR